MEWREFETSESHASRVDYTNCIKVYTPPLVKQAGRGEIALKSGNVVALKLIV